MASGASGEIRNDIEQFKASLKKLNSGVSKASGLWQDQKYRELSAAVGQVASQAVKVVQTGESCCTELERFARIAAEQY